MNSTNLQADSRRHDLDALRAFAMLLGIVLHGAMSFIPGIGFFWGVQDVQASPMYGVLLAVIHGWRMALFFLVSGFFTAMLWRKRGLRALLVHRFRRIFLPLVLAMMTIVPSVWIVSSYVRARPSGMTATQDTANENSLAGSAASQSSARPITPTTDIHAAVATGDFVSIQSYLDGGGDVLAKDSYGSTPLHVACLFGRADEAALLLEANASLDVRNDQGQLPEDFLNLDWSTTAFIARMVQLSVEQDALLAGRERIAVLMSEKTGREVSVSLGANQSFAGMTGLAGLLFEFPVFHHLWFLWFLCWYVCGFALVVTLLNAVRIPAVPTKWLSSARRYVWLLPLTAVPQYYMVGDQHLFGPATSIGLLPLPSVLAYYAIFFAYGAMYFDADDREVVVGKGFIAKLLLAILLLFPLGLILQGMSSTTGQVLFALIQVTYAWVVSFGMIGLFHWLCRSPKPWVRYVSDSSYWLYLAHIPWIVIVQFVVRDWMLPSVVKFVIICVVTTLSLLVSYQLFVRNTWLGVLLNGRRYSTPSLLGRKRVLVAEANVETANVDAANVDAAK